MKIIHLILIILLIACKPVKNNTSNINIDTTNTKQDTAITGEAFKPSTYYYNIETKEVHIENNYTQSDDNLKDILWLFIVLSTISIILLLVIIIMLYIKGFFKLRLDIS